MYILPLGQEHDFYHETQFLPQNAIFVREYADKAAWVTRLGISIFFDDHIKVVQLLLPLPGVVRIFWMHANTRQFAQHIPKEYRHKIALTQRWANTMKYFQKIPTKQHQGNEKEE